MSDRGKPQLFPQLPSRNSAPDPYYASPHSSPCAQHYVPNMVELNLDQILETTDTIVQELLATGEFGHCTFKDVLYRIDTRLEFPRGTLLRYEQKSTVKELIKELLLQADKKNNQILSSPKKRTVQPEPETGGKSNKRRKTNVEASDQEDSDDEPESKKVKKSRSKSKVKRKEIKVDKVSKTETKKSDIKSSASGKTAKAVISAELIDTDLDDTDPEPSTSKPLTSASSLKKSNQRIVDSDGGEDDTVGTSKPTKPQPSQKRPNAERIPEVKLASGDKSESEISVLFDDEPPKRQRKTKGEKDETKPKRTRQKKEKKDLSKDEETIKRLKSLVVACGVRKVWSKEFKDLGHPSAQIQRLKSILAELGMSGRMSMEQAKAIKAKREFAQELEDVKDFEKKVVGRSEGRSSRKKLGSGRKDVESSEEDEDEDGDDDEEDDKPRKKRTNARNSINAFLEDQSDED